MRPGVVDHPGVVDQEHPLCFQRVGDKRGHHPAVEETVEGGVLDRRGQAPAIDHVAHPGQTRGHAPGLHVRRQGHDHGVHLFTPEIADQLEHGPGVEKGQVADGGLEQLDAGLVLEPFVQLASGIGHHMHVITPVAHEQSEVVMPLLPAAPGLVGIEKTDGLGVHSRRYIWNVWENRSVRPENTQRAQEVDLRETDSSSAKKAHPGFPGNR